jgi:carbonic anhydrase
MHDPNEQVTDWQAALRYLKAGNGRYCENRPVSRIVSAEEKKGFERGQKPFAVIVTCFDSRVAPEIFFDLRHGDAFVIRNAGNIANEPVIGGIEFAVEFVKVPLVVVVGHSCCAAVINAFADGEYSGELGGLMAHLRRAIEGSKDEDEAIRKNMEYAVKQISENDVVKRMGAKVMGAFYDLGTGEVCF